MKIGCMVWRIGEILDFFQQIAWLKANGFQEVSFHTIPGQPGVYQGFDPYHASQADLARLIEALKGFQDIDIHAPFFISDIHLASPNARIQETCLREIEKTIWLAGEIGAKVVTIHPTLSPAFGGSADPRSILKEPLLRLDQAAAQAGVRVGLEIEQNYDLPEAIGAHHTGITLDVGHVCFRNGAGYRDYGSIGGLIREFADRMFHLHVHDYDGQNDHIPIGSGFIDFPDIVSALHDIGYQGSLCLELNPDRVSPDDILKSRDRLQQLIEAERS